MQTFELVDKIFKLNETENVSKIQTETSFYPDIVWHISDGLHRNYEIRRLRKDIDKDLYGKYTYEVKLQSFSYGFFHFYIGPDSVKIVKNDTGYSNKETILGWLNEFYDLASADIVKGLSEWKDRQEATEKLEKELLCE